MRRDSLSSGIGARRPFDASPRPAITYRPAFSFPLGSMLPAVAPCHPPNAGRHPKARPEHRCQVVASAVSQALEVALDFMLASASGQGPEGSVGVSPAWFGDGDLALKSNVFRR
jgi:hypothetical protein